MRAIGFHSVFDHTCFKQIERFLFALIVRSMFVCAHAFFFVVYGLPRQRPICLIVEKSAQHSMETALIEEVSAKLRISAPSGSRLERPVNLFESSENYFSLTPRKRMRLPVRCVCCCIFSLLISARNFLRVRLMQFSRVCAFLLPLKVLFAQD